MKRILLFRKLDEADKQKIESLMENVSMVVESFGEVVRIS